MIIGNGKNPVERLSDKAQQKENVCPDDSTLSVCVCVGDDDTQMGSSLYSASSYRLLKGQSSPALCGYMTGLILLRCTFSRQFIYRILHYQIQSLLTHIWRPEGPQSNGGHWEESFHFWVVFHSHTPRFLSSGHSWRNPNLCWNWKANCPAQYLM